MCEEYEQVIHKRNKFAIFMKRYSNSHLIENNQWVEQGRVMGGIGGTVIEQQ